MADEPDLNHDMDALFSHMKDNLEMDPSEPSEWHFTFRSTDASALEAIGESLSDEFEIYFQESVETIEDGKSFDGPPMLAVVMSGVFTAAQIKSYYDRFAKLAQENHLDYEGASSFEAFDEDEVFGWLNLEDAVWRLRVFTDTGLLPGDALPFLFAIEPTGKTSIEKLVADVQSGGMGDAEHLSDEDGEVVAVHVSGRNDDSVLAEAYKGMEALASKHHAVLLGVQYLSQEDPELEE